MKFELNLGKYTKNLKSQLITQINKASSVLKQDIDEKSPVDTGDFKEHNSEVEAFEVGSKIIGGVINDSEHNIGVEIGFKSYAVNWHKYKGGPVIHTGIGARPFTRAFDEKQEELKKIITKIGLEK